MSRFEDKLIEFKPRYEDAIYGVRNGSYKAYVWDLGRTPEPWEGDRYKVSLVIGNELTGYHRESNDPLEAMEYARQAVSGRAFRLLLRRMR